MLVFLLPLDFNKTNDTEIFGKVKISENKKYDN